MPLNCVQLDALVLQPASPDLEDSSNRPPVWRHTTVKVRLAIAMHRNTSKAVLTSFGLLTLLWLPKQGQQDL